MHNYKNHRAGTIIHKQCAKNTFLSVSFFFAVFPQNPIVWARRHYLRERTLYFQATCLLSGSYTGIRLIHANMGVHTPAPRIDVRSTGGGREDGCVLPEGELWWRQPMLSGVMTNWLWWDVDAEESLNTQILSALVPMSEVSSRLEIGRASCRERV